MRSFVRFLLKLLPYEERAEIALSTVDGIGASSILEVNDEGAILVRGESLDGERLRGLRESARTELRSPARRLVQEQLTYKASQIALTGDTRHQRLFARAAVWWGMEEDKLYKLLAGEGTSPI